MIEYQEQNREAELSLVRQKLIPILELEDREAFRDEGDDFLDERIRKLCASEASQTIEVSQGRHQAFIQPETNVAASLSSETYNVVGPVYESRGYKLDDPEAYDETIPYMRKFYQRFAKDIDPERAYFNAAIFTAQYVQQSYFGTVHNSPEAFAERELLVGEFTDMDDPKAVSIRDFKERAFCAERAAVANNVLQILGFSPVYEMGSVNIEGKETEDHVYLRVRSPAGKEIVFDPTNPSLVFDRSNNLLEVRPAMYPVGDAFSAEAARPLEVKHKTYTVDDAGAITSQEMSYVYSLNPEGSNMRPV